MLHVGRNIGYFTPKIIYLLSIKTLVQVKVSKRIFYLFLKTESLVAHLLEEKSDEFAQNDAVRKALSELVHDHRILVNIALLKADNILHLL